MGKDTSISWCHHTFSPWWGCSRVSPGCNNCYAQAFDHRLGGDHWQLKGPRKFFGDKRWAEPLKWAKAAARAGERRRVFCASMSDVFEDRRDLDVWRDRLWELIELTPELDWLLLTKRPENFSRMLPWVQQSAHAKALGMNDDVIAEVSKPWRNVWLGTTTENQEYADLRIPLLLAAPAVVHFLSAEPQIGRVDLSTWFREGGQFGRDNPNHANASGGGHVRSGASPATGNVSEPQAGPGGSPAPVARPLLSWVISGCESGHGARPCEIEWLRVLRDQCAAAGVAYFLKQAEHAPNQWMTGTSATLVLGADTGSKTKGKGPRGGRIIELPYLDGVQHADFPKELT